MRNALLLAPADGVVALEDGPEGAEARPADHHQPADHGVWNGSCCARPWACRGRPASCGSPGPAAAAGVGPAPRLTLGGGIAGLEVALARGQAPWPRTPSAALTGRRTGISAGGGPAAAAARRFWAAGGALAGPVGALAQRHLAGAVVPAGRVQGIAQRAQNAVRQRCVRRADAVRQARLSSFMVLSFSQGPLRPLRAVHSRISTASGRARSRRRRPAGPAPALAVDAHAVAVLAAQVGDHERLLRGALDHARDSGARPVSGRRNRCPVPADANEPGCRAAAWAAASAFHGQPRLVRVPGICRPPVSIFRASAPRRRRTAAESRRDGPAPRTRLHEPGDERRPRQHEEAPKGR